MAKKRKDRERRKVVRQQRQEEKLQNAVPRERHSLVGHVRSGDHAKLDLRFSGRQVLVDPEHPEELGRRDELARVWEDLDHAASGSRSTN